MSDEAGEIVVFEVIRKKSERELRDVIDDETVIGLRPKDDGVGGRIFNHIVTFGQERCHGTRAILARCFHHNRIQRKTEESRNE